MNASDRIDDSEGVARARASDPVRVHLTNPEKELFEAGPSGASPVTKAQLATYMESVASAMLPDLKSRPLSVVRCPEGPGSECFFQKHLSHENLPRGLRTFEIVDQAGPATYFSVENLDGLLALVQLNVVEIHAWNSHADTPETPDRIIFDLDPGPGLVWRDVLDAAHAIREALGELGLGAFPKTTGGRGLHVVSPIVPELTHDLIRLFVRGIVDRLMEAAPDHFTAQMAKTARAGRVFIDYLRNSHGATAIAAYSTRGRPGAPVAVPVTWEELDAGLDPQSFDTVSVPLRLAHAHGRHPWQGYEHTRVRMTAEHFAAAGVALPEGFGGSPDAA